jgi:hypothetical protein
VTEDEYKNLRLAADATAARSLMLWAGRLLHDALPHEDHLRTECTKVMQRKLAAARADYLQMTFPEMPAAVSDLWAGEAQEAFDRLSKAFWSCLVPSSKKE